MSVWDGIWKSDFLIDYSQKTDCKILLDYKIYNGNRENSYGI